MDVLPTWPWHVHFRCEHASCSLWHQQLLVVHVCIQTMLRHSEPHHGTERYSTMSPIWHGRVWTSKSSKLLRKLKFMHEAIRGFHFISSLFIKCWQVRIRFSVDIAPRTFDPEDTAAHAHNRYHKAYSKSKCYSTHQQVVVMLRVFYIDNTRPYCYKLN